MDERLQYEQLIGSKLQGLPIPDMQDAIWARVKAQLDIDLPTSDPDEGSLPQPPKGPGSIGWGLSVVIIALVSTFLILKNKPRVKDDTNNPATTEQTNSPAVQNTGPPDSKQSTTRKTAPSADSNSASAPAFVIDSATKGDVTAIDNLSMDSAKSKTENNLQITPAEMRDSTAPLKKGKGMKGLNDSDYRIVPKTKN
jgi:hypothetical protein